MLADVREALKNPKRYVQVWRHRSRNNKVDKSQLLEQVQRCPTDLRDLHEAAAGLGNIQGDALIRNGPHPHQWFESRGLVDALPPQGCLCLSALDEPPEDRPIPYTIKSGGTCDRRRDQ